MTIKCNPDPADLVALLTGYQAGRISEAEYESQMNDLLGYDDLPDRDLEVEAEYEQRRRATK